MPERFSNDESIKSLIKAEPFKDQQQFYKKNQYKLTRLIIK